MDIKYCSATTPHYFQKTITSRINKVLLEDLSNLATPPAKFERLKGYIKTLVTQPKGWMFYDFPFEVQVHPCFSQLHVEFIGSTSEGLSISEVTEGSENEELDLTAILQTTIATEAENSDESRTWLEIQHCRENPGFVLLKVHMKDNSEHWCGLSNLVSNQDGSINEFFLSPVAFTDEFYLMLCLRCSVENLHYTAYCKDVDKLFDNEMDKDKKRDFDKEDALHEFFIVTQEGPAVKTTVLFADRDLSLQYDCSLAVQCFEWPSIADDFLHRNRLSGFPSLEFVQQLSSMSCLLVPKFPQDSKTQLEWRLSFCLVERELMLNLTEAQRRCYLVFKAIWRQFFCPPIGKALQSYHLKNVFLWECENVPFDEWTDEKMVARVTGLLQRLQYNLFTKYCPHYILPQNNLFRDIDQSLLFYAGMRVQTAIFKSDVVWINNDVLFYLPPHKSRTSLGRKLRKTCIMALKYVIEAMVSSCVKTENRNEKSTKYKLSTEAMNSLRLELEQSFNKNMTEIILQYINSSLKHRPDNITRYYICSRADPKQLLIASKTQLLDGLASLANTVMNWGNMMEIITGLEVLETENLKEYGYREEYRLTERLRLLFRMGMDDFGAFRSDSRGENFEEDSDDSMFGDFVCDECESGILEERYHCKTCSDFDLCKSCYSKTSHPHEFEFVEEQDDIDDDYDDEDDFDDDDSQHEMECKQS